MKKTVAVLLLTLVLLSTLLCSCGGTEYTDRVLGGREDFITLRMANTYVSGAAVSEADFDRLAEDCARITSEHDGILSCHNENSHVYALNNKVNMIMSPSETLYSVLTLAEDLSELTGGAYLHTIGALTEAWSRDSLPTDKKIETAKKHIGADSLKIKKRVIEKSDAKVKIDLDGIVNGYTVQKLVERLDSAGLAFGLVSLGETVGVFGTKPTEEPFKVGVSDPADRQSSIGYLHIDSGFVSVCATYHEERVVDGVKCHGIIDPETGRPADSGLVSVAVWASNGSVADALSTALLVMGEEKALSFYSEQKITFEAVMINENGEIILTDGLKDGVFEAVSENYSVK